MTHKGVLCQCGRFMKFTPYYYAHMDVPLAIQCLCQTKHSLLHDKLVAPVKGKIVEKECD